MNSDRKLEILNAVIKEYIRTGKPVSSQLLEKKYKFGVKSASIRSVFNELTEQGYLRQTHTSGGRVPTDAGYEFFVQQKFSESQAPRLPATSDLLSKFIRGEIDRFLHEFSHQFGILGAGYEYKGNDLYRSGLDSLVENLELEDKKEFYEIARDFENLHEKLQKRGRGLLGGNKSGPKIFIGEKSPITQSPQLSVIMDEFEMDGQPMLLIAIGPKRMDYQKTLNVFKMLKEKSN